MADQNKYQKLIFRIALLLCIMSFVLALVLGIGYKDKYIAYKISDNANITAKKDTEEVAKQINDNIIKVMHIAKTTANTLSKKPLEDNKVNETLKDAIGKDPLIYKVGAVYVPYAYNSSRKLFAPYYKNETGNLILEELAYDYTRRDFYNKTLEVGARWEIGVSESTGDLVAEYSLPFNHTNTSTPAGFIFIQYSLDKIRHLDSLKPNRSGYGFILTEEGKMLSHPIEDYICRNLSDIVAGDEFLQKISKNYTKNDNISIQIEDQNFIVFFRPIPSTNWTLGVVFLDEEIQDYEKEGMRGEQIKIVMAIIAFLFFLSILLFRADNGSTRSLWAVAIFFSLLCIIGMCFVWYLTIENTPEKIDGDVRIFDRADSEAALIGLLPDVAKSEDRLIRVPTGIFLQSIRFSSAYNVIVTGYIWQDYASTYLFSLDEINETKDNDRFYYIMRQQPFNVSWITTANITKTEDSKTINFTSENNSNHLSITLENKTRAILQIDNGKKYELIVKTKNNKQNVYFGVINEMSPEFIFSDPGVIFPEAEDIEIEEKYYSNDEVIGWYFTGELRQKFDSSKYPFDNEDVWIRLWPEDFNKNLILTPDFNSYKSIDSGNKPGLEKDIVLEGWDIEESYFSYRKHRYDTTFGFVEDYKEKEFPELYFNVGIKRNFLSAFISNLVPLFVISLLLFAVLMISTEDEQKRALYGFSSYTVLAYCAALFFVLIVSHISLREKLAATGIIYLEYFYFVLYLAILTVSINSILLVSNTKYKFIWCKDNLIIKLLYWPVILILLLGITLKNFY